MKKYRINGCKPNLGMPALIGISAALFLAITASTNLAAQDTKSKTESGREQARFLFERGVSYFHAGQYELALDSFQQANSLRPNPVVRLNIANCYEQLNHPIEAIFNFERFLADGETSAEQRKAVEATIKKLRAKISDVHLQVTPDGASVLIDGSHRRVAPIVEPIPLTAGTHVIEVTYPDYRSERREIEVSGGKPMEMSIILRRQATAAQMFETPIVAPGPQARLVPKETQPAEPQGPVPEQAPPETAPQTLAPLADVAPEELSSETPASEQPSTDYPRNRNRAVLISGIITAGLAATTAILGGLALGAKSDYEVQADKWKDTALSPSDRDNARNEANDLGYQSKNLALASDIILATTFVGAAVTGCLYFLWPKPSEQQSADLLLPTLGLNHAGLLYIKPL
jgi:hypothetical protein